MARVRKTKAKKAPRKNAGKIVRKRKGKTTRVAFDLKRRAVEARAMVTINVPEGAARNAGKWNVPDGAIVRLDPDPGATAEDVEAVRRMMEEVAVVVKVLPMLSHQTKHDEVEAQEEVEDGDLAAPRDAILSVARNTKGVDKAMLVELCEDMMAEVGL